MKAVLPVWLGVRIHVGKLSCSKTKTMLCLDPHFYQSKAPVYYRRAAGEAGPVTAAAALQMYTSIVVQLHEASWSTTPVQLL